MTETGVSLRDHVEAALDAQVRPRLHAHAGGVESRVDDEGNVSIKFLGACIGCPVKGATAQLGIAPVLEAIPGVRSVTYEGVWISVHAQRRLRAAAQRSRERFSLLRDVRPASPEDVGVAP